MLLPLQRQPSLDMLPNYASLLEPLGLDQMLQHQLLSFCLQAGADGRASVVVHAAPPLVQHYEHASSPVTLASPIPVIIFYFN